MDRIRHLAEQEVVEQIRQHDEYLVVADIYREKEAWPKDLRSARDRTPEIDFKELPKNRG